MVTTTGQYMVRTAKLYWRINEDGHRRWKAIFPDGLPDELTDFLHVIYEGPWEEEE